MQNYLSTYYTYVGYISGFGYQHRAPSWNLYTKERSHACSIPAAAAERPGPLAVLDPDGILLKSRIIKEGHDVGKYVWAVAERNGRQLPAPRGLAADPGF